ncbi:unnamed protein product, partial [Ceratitis capitata]
IWPARKLVSGDSSSSSSGQPLRINNFIIMINSVAATARAGAEAVASAAQQ